jgi:hypothetical protein
MMKIPAIRRKAAARRKACSIYPFSVPLYCLTGVFLVGTSNSKLLTANL